MRFGEGGFVSFRLAAQVFPKITHRAVGFRQRFRRTVVGNEIVGRFLFRYNQNGVELSPLAALSVGAGKDGIRFHTSRIELNSLPGLLNCFGIGRIEVRQGYPRPVSAGLFFHRFAKKFFHLTAISPESGQSGLCREALGGIDARESMLAMCSAMAAAFTLSPPAMPGASR